MTIRPDEIAAVARELAPLAGARVDAVRVHAERALTLELAGAPSGSVTLLLSAEPGRARIHAASRRPPQPPAPFGWQSILRRELAGARLAELRADPGARRVELLLDRAAGRLRLVAELDGRDGNLLLARPDGAVLAAARGAAGRVAPLGEAAGARGVEGDGGGGATPADEVRPLAAAAARPAAAPERFPASAAVEERDRAEEEERALAEGRRRLREPARAALARSRRALAKLAEEAARVPAAEEDRRRADLLKANLHAIPRGAREARLTEWTADGPRELRFPLDPAVPPREAMERLYRRYRRIVESAARVAARAEEVRAREEELVRHLRAIEGAAEADLPRLEREARRLGAAPRPPPPPRSRRDEPAPPFRTFRSLAGVPLLVGRSAADNDALTVRVARGNDLWLHARGRGGAHVVARLERGRPPDGETLLDGAHLAAHFSDARGEPQVEVVATRAKHVRKVRGAAPGAVTYSQERTLLLRLERPRIDRLLASEESPER